MDKSTLRQRARNLRKNSTDAERHLWYHLRANRLGFKFKRQVPIGAYIVDFVCLEKRLIIERTNTRTDCFCGFVVAASHRILMHFYNRAIKHVPFVIAIFFLILPVLR